MPLGCSYCFSLLFEVVCFMSLLQAVKVLDGEVGI